MAKKQRAARATVRPGQGVFQLSILGGAPERQWVRLRPQVARLPWGTLARMKLSDELRTSAIRAWTGATYTEHCAAASMATAVTAMVKTCAPLDLVAQASRFIYEELSHAELCARIVAELGAAAPLPYDADRVGMPAQEGISPIAAACENVISVFCRSESLALPLVREQLKRPCASPLIEGVIRQVGREEGPHAAFGWVFLDWAAPYLDTADRRHLRKVSAEAVNDVEELMASVEDDDSATLGWLSPAEFRRTAKKALDEEIAAPLQERGLL